MQIIKLLFIVYCMLFTMTYAQAYDQISPQETIDELDFITSEDDTTIQNQNTQNNKDIQLNQKFNQESNIFKDCDQAKLIAINKTTAKSKHIMLKSKHIRYFGNIGIQMHKCIKNLNQYTPDNYILLTVIENKIDEDPNLIFQGWITSSDISASVMEHPIYELFLQECI